MRRSEPGLALGTGSAFAIFAATWTIAVAALAFPRVDVRAQSAGGDAVQGRLAFEKRCTGCHSLDKNMEGPRLRNVYGRPAGSIPDFTYSDALKNAHFTWDSELLNRWLAKPDSLVPDTDMDFHIANEEERANIIQFLRLSSGK